MYDPKTIDPDNVPTNTETSLKLPQVIDALDYHDFGQMQAVFEKVGMTVIVEEVGFVPQGGFYVGVVHLGRPEDRELIEALSTYYGSLEEE